MSASPTLAAGLASNRGYNFFLLAVAGLGGLLYGVDVGIIGGALPYLQATYGLNPGELSIIVAAVLLGSVLSTLFAGLLADLIGRKPLMLLSGVVFIVSIPMIALAHGFWPLFFGRLLQGTSGGFIGIVVPLYLAECLIASDRGKGTGVFQWLLTFGIFCAAAIGMYFSYRVNAVANAGDASALFQFKDHAWRQIFWVSLPPGILFVIGSFFVSESPRWLYMRGKQSEALAALLRSRSTEQASLELNEIHAGLATSTTSGAHSESLLRRKYVLPFLLACIILFCNTATGVNSVIGYNTNILLQAGLSDIAAHWGYVLFTLINFLMTIVAMSLVDKKGRKFLLTLGTSGVIVSMLVVGTLFRSSEKHSIDTSAAVQAMVGPDQELHFTFDAAKAKQLLATTGDTTIDPTDATFAIIYSYGDFTASTNYISTRDSGSAPVAVTRADALPDGKVQAFFTNPFANLEASRTAPLHIQKAVLNPIPSSSHGWTVAVWLYIFMSFFAIGPGVCVWLALSELMPTRIRSNGMSIALVINQMVSTTLAGIFLPVVSKHGYSSMFYLFAGFTVIYFITAAFFLPETKGKTLEEIEKYFEAA